MHCALVLLISTFSLHSRVLNTSFFAVASSWRWNTFCDLSSMCIVCDLFEFLTRRIELDQFNLHQFTRKNVMKWCLRGFWENDRWFPEPTANWHCSSEKSILTLSIQNLFSTRLKLKRNMLIEHVLWCIVPVCLLFRMSSNSSRRLVPFNKLS